MQQNEIYVNPKQEQFLNNTAVEISTMFGGRGGGKTGSLAFRAYERAARMPRGRFFLGASTLDQVKNVILPDVKKIWREALGLKEGVHFVISRKPPKFYPTPLSPPETYENVISWWNGSWTEIISYRKYKTYRGASYDGGDIDEGLLWSWYAISNILIPTLRGNLERFKHEPLHHNISIYSSPPRDANGFWIYNMEKKAEAEPKKFGWVFCNYKDNIEIVGADYGRRMKDALDHEDYLVEVECERQRIAGDAFYHAFKYDLHGYLTTTKGQIIGKKFSDYDPNKPIDLSFDFGANINVMWLAQEKDLTIYLFDAMFVKFKEKLPALIQRFTTAYQHHKHKHVNLYGEPFGLNKREDNVPLFQQVQKFLLSQGWTSKIWVKRNDQADTHKNRHLKINQLLLEDEPTAPRIRIHRERCDDAIISIMRTKVKEDFGKNKNEEKHPKKYPPEHAPHFTDALDNYIRQRYGYFYHDTNTKKGNAGVQ